MILIIDNYDSFTYNLCQRIGRIYPDVRIVRNDKITADGIESMKPDAVVISPGPGRPDKAGVSVEAVRRLDGKIPILGVCLGHQAIGEAFGGRTVRAPKLMHGKAGTVTLKNSCPLFSGLPEKIQAARYHSLVAERSSLPCCLEVTAEDEDGQIMGIRHKGTDTYGLQFHPESVLTGEGDKILYNFLKGVCKLKTQTVTSAPMPAEKRVGLKPYIAKVVDGADLTESEAKDAMGFIMGDKATDSQIASFITAMRMKGETTQEITGFAKVMREKAVPVPMSPAAVDIVGTGGDLAKSFNISTTAAFVAAGAGLKVAKHGNRSVSSKSGAADVLEALGVNINLTPEQAAECMEKCGLTFLFAQRYHGSMRFAAAPRKETGIRTVFNILGPLANPAHAQAMLLGVYDEKLLAPLAKVLINLGIKKALIVYGQDCLDEISVSAKTSVMEINEGKTIKYEINPEDYGIKFSEKSDIVGGTAEENAKITLSVLNGEKGPKRDIVLINAAGALYAGGMASSIQKGLDLAAYSIDSGNAVKKLDGFKKITNGFGG